MSKAPVLDELVMYLLADSCHILSYESLVGYVSFCSVHLIGLISIELACSMAK